MLIAGAVCPGPPLLVPQVGVGRPSELAALRDACVNAVDLLLAAAPERVVVVGEAPVTGPVEGELDLSVFGVAEYAPSKPLPLALGLGQWLLHAGLARASASGSRREPVVELHGISPSASVNTCADVGAAIGVRGGRVAILAIGDASNARPPAAPRPPSQQAESFDAAIAQALANADCSALLELDITLAAGVGAAGRAAWQVLAGAAAASSTGGVEGIGGTGGAGGTGGTGRTWTGRVHYDAAPFGVGYLVASWQGVPDQHARSDATARSADPVVATS